MHDIHFKNVEQHFLWPTNILARSKITPPWYMTKSLAGIVDLCWTKPSHRDGARSRFDVADCLILMHYCSIGLQSSLLVRDWNSVSRLFFLCWLVVGEGAPQVKLSTLQVRSTTFWGPKCISSANHKKNFQVFVSFHWFPLVSQFPETENPETGTPGRLLLNMKFVCNKYYYYTSIVRVNTSMVSIGFC